MITSGSKCRLRNNSSMLFSSLTVGPQLSKDQCTRRAGTICTRTVATISEPMRADCHPECLLFLFRFGERSPDELGLILLTKAGLTSSEAQECLRPFKRRQLKHLVLLELRSEERRVGKQC